MTISINRTISVKDTNGHLIQVNGEESLITKSEITLACSGPNCAKRNGKIVSTTFIEEELQANPDSASSTFRRFGQWKFNLAVKEFCSLECAEDILREARNTPKPELVQKTDGEPTAEDLDKAVTEIIPGVTATVEV